MFVFCRDDLPLDPVFPSDLEKLGYFVNEKDQIKKISDPEEDFQFKINRNPRWNEMQREAMNACIRDIVYSRLRNLGLVTLGLPLSSTCKEARVPILVSKNLSTAKRIIVIFGEPVQDLGIWAYRTIGSESIHAGSAVSFARALKDMYVDGTYPKGEGQEEAVALVLANTGQLIWHCGTGQAITLQSWDSLPRQSAVDPPLVMTKRNQIPGNKDWEEHVKSVFNEVLAARGKFVSQDAKIDIIGLSEGGLATVRYLSKNWSIWRPYISAMCLGSPLHSTQTDLVGDDEEGPASFKAFLSSRSRAYVLSDLILGIPVSDTQNHGCNCYSSGEALNVECIMPQAWQSMLQWLTHAYENPHYCEEQLEMREFDPVMPVRDANPGITPTNEIGMADQDIETSSLEHMHSENGRSLLDLDTSGEE